MHGYQANAELVRREIKDWAGISRPQVYYSLEKLARAGMIRSLETDEPASGPERSSFETTAKGRAALADALEREEWTTQRDRPPFLTWVALSWQARPGVVKRQIARRREFLEKGIAKEKEVLRSILQEVGHPYHEAVWMVSSDDRAIQSRIAVARQSGKGASPTWTREAARIRRRRKENVTQRHGVRKRRVKAKNRNWGREGCGNRSGIGCGSMGWFLEAWFWRQLQSTAKRLGRRRSGRLREK